MIASSVTRALVVVVAALAPSLGCGLANGIAHVEHPFYFDLSGYCAACGRGELACEVDGTDRTCVNVGAFQDCDFDGGGDPEDLVLSPAPEEDLFARPSSSDECGIGTGEYTIDLIVYDPGKDSHIAFSSDDQDGDSAGRIELVGGTAGERVIDWESTQVDDDGDGAVYFVTMSFCVATTSPGIALRIVEDDGEQANELCLGVDNDAEEE